AAARRRLATLVRRGDARQLRPHRSGNPVARLGARGRPAQRLAAYFRVACGAPRRTRSGAGALARSAGTRAARPGRPPCARPALGGNGAPRRGTRPPPPDVRTFSASLPAAPALD